jgi:DNA-binding LacI/PurR family transcriptional regulator
MNLEAVAKRANVSTATVSRVLNNVPSVKGSTRTRVMQAIEELKYQPNLNARNLAGGKSKTIGMIVSNMENPFFFDIIKVTEADAHTKGYEIVVANTDYRQEQLVKRIQLMLARRVAGLALIVSEMDAALVTELTASKIPILFYDAFTTERGIWNIRVDYASGIRRLVDYLHRAGHTRMAFVNHHSNLGPLVLRKETFESTVPSLTPRVEWTTITKSDGLDGGRLAAREILDSGFKPTAILCVNDFMAVGVLRELRERGLRVPEDVSVTGFDDVKLSQYCYPALTTVHVPREFIGHQVFQALVPDPNVESEPREIIVEPHVVLRESTAPARTAQFKLPA